MKEIRFYFSTTEYSAYYVSEDWEETDMFDLLDDNPTHFDIEKDKLNVIPIRINMEKILMVAFVIPQKKIDDTVTAEIK